MASRFNMSMNPGPSIERYVNLIAWVTQINVYRMSVPSALLFLVAHLTDIVAKPLGTKHLFSPVRIRQRIRSNNILPSYFSRIVMIINIFKIRLFAIGKRSVLKNGNKILD